jgi:hypothetical protein
MKNKKAENNQVLDYKSSKLELLLVQKSKN